MTPIMLALIAHLFISAYCLFGVWRYNLLTSYGLLDTFDYQQEYFFSRTVLGCVLIGVCLMPVFNSFQLYTIIRLDLAVISDDLLHQHHGNRPAPYSWNPSYVIQSGT